MTDPRPRPAPRAAFTPCLAAVLATVLATGLGATLAAQGNKPPPKPKPPQVERVWIFPGRAVVQDGVILDLTPQLLLDSGLQGLGVSALELQRISALWMQGKKDAVLQRAAAMIAEKPTAHGGYTLRYLTELRLGKDREAAHRTANLAAGALRKHPAELVKFVEQALFADATPAEYRLALMALAPVVPDHPNDAAVRIAHLRALAGAGKLREAVITNKDIVKDLEGDPAGLLKLARTIVEMDNGRALGGVAQKALARAEAKLPADQGLLKTKYRLLHDLLGLHKQAREVGEELVGGLGMGTELNNFVWFLMVDTPDAGKYPSLALLGARRMLKATSIKVNEWDTIALAFFRNGLVDEAIRYQKKALSMPGATSAYRERLAMYEKAKADADRKDGKDEGRGQPRDR